jgi:hypothetical protein
MPNFQGVWSLSEQYQAIGSQNWPMAPGAPTGVSASAGNTQATVSFTAPSFTGVPPGITQYLVTSDPGAITETGASSPITVTGLSNGTAYTFTVRATNGVQYGPAGGPSGSVTPSLPTGLIFGGSTATGPVDNISRVTISSTGNATDFGDLTTNVFQSGACSSGTRAIRGGGQTTGSSDSAVNTMDYVTISSTGNATDFGDLLTQTRYGVACSSSTRGIFWGGRDVAGTKTNTIQYVTIASTGNATDFGDMLGTEYDGGALASPTRGVQAAGGEGSTVIQYVTIASTGNAIDFGDIDFSGSFNSGGLKASSNSTRGVWSGFLQEPVWTQSNVIQYITIATTGNSVDFGDLTLARKSGASMTGGDRALFVSGQSQATAFTNVIDYITITSLGNATDFGDLSYATYSPSAASNGHGGLS